MEITRNKLSVIRAMLAKLDTLRDEWAAHRVEWELMNVVAQTAQNSELDQNVKVVKDQLAQRSIQLNTIEKALTNMVGENTIEEVRQRFVQLANAYNIVSDLEEALARRKMFLLMVDSTGAPWDWGADNGAYDHSVEQRKTDVLEAQLKEAQNILSAVDSNINIKDPTSLVSVKNTIQVIR